MIFVAKQIEKASTLKSAKTDKESKDMKPLFREDENGPIKLDLQLGSKRPKPDLVEDPSDNVVKPQKVPKPNKIVETPFRHDRCSDKLPSPKITFVENLETTSKPLKIMASCSSLAYVL